MSDVRISERTKLFIRFMKDDANLYPWLMKQIRQDFKNKKTYEYLDLVIFNLTTLWRKWSKTPTMPPTMWIIDYYCNLFDNSLSKVDIDKMLDRAIEFDIKHKIILEQ